MAQFAYTLARIAIVFIAGWYIFYPNSNLCKGKTNNVLGGNKMKKIDKNKPVMITGATGYVAGWIVKKLLAPGFPLGVYL